MNLSKEEVYNNVSKNINIDKLNSGLFNLEYECIKKLIKTNIPEKILDILCFPVTRKKENEIFYLMNSIKKFEVECLLICIAYQYYKKRYKYELSDKMFKTNVLGYSLKMLVLSSHYYNKIYLGFPIFGNYDSIDGDMAVILLPKYEQFDLTFFIADCLYKKLSNNNKKKYERSQIIIKNFWLKYKKSLKVIKPIKYFYYYPHTLTRNLSSQFKEVYMKKITFKKKYISDFKHFLNEIENKSEYFRICDLIIWTALLYYKEKEININNENELKKQLIYYYIYCVRLNKINPFNFKDIFNCFKKSEFKLVCPINNYEDRFVKDKYRDYDKQMYQCVLSRLLLTYKVERIYYSVDKNIIEERTNNFANEFLSQLEKEDKDNKKKERKKKNKNNKKKERKKKKQKLIQEKLLKNTIKKCIMIQSIFRMYLIKKKIKIINNIFKRIKINFIKKFLKNNLINKKTIKIQSLFRMHIIKRRIKKIKNIFKRSKVNIIISFFKNILKGKKIIKIQSFIRMFLSNMKLNNKLKYMIKNILLRKQQNENLILKLNEKNTFYDDLINKIDKKIIQHKNKKKGIDSNLNPNAITFISKIHPKVKNNDVLISLVNKLFLRRSFNKLKIKKYKKKRKKKKKKFSK